jgi:hypothetical protein
VVALDVVGRCHRLAILLLATDVIRPGGERLGAAVLAVVNTVVGVCSSTRVSGIASDMRHDGTRLDGRVVLVQETGLAGGLE